MFLPDARECATDNVWTCVHPSQVLLIIVFCRQMNNYALLPYVSFCSCCRTMLGSYNDVIEMLPWIARHSQWIICHGFSTIYTSDRSSKMHSVADRKPFQNLRDAF
jgi:hypothetical protein